jgi:hypothetical protein
MRAFDTFPLLAFDGAMQMKLTFLGATGTVTGSKHLVESFLAPRAMSLVHAELGGPPPCFVTPPSHSSTRGAACSF